MERQRRLVLIVGGAAAFTLAVAGPAVARRWLDSPSGIYCALGWLDTSPRTYGADAERSLRFSWRVEVVLRRARSPADLKTLFYLCYRQACATAGEYGEHHPYWTACEGILVLLADAGTDEAARVLVELFLDESIGYDGGFAEGILHQVSRCGTKALPYLEGARTERWSRHLEELKAAIRRGETYG
jgi:hypothetical protein